MVKLKSKWVRYAGMNTSDFYMNGINKIIKEQRSNPGVSVPPIGKTKTTI